MHFRRTRPDVIRHAQTPAPLRRSNAPGQRCKQRLRVRVRNRQHGNLRDRLRFLHLQPLRVFGRANSRRQRIARVKWHVRHASPLHAVRWAIRSAGERLALDETIFMRVGKDKASHRSVLRCNFRLDAAP